MLVAQNISVLRGGRTLLEALDVSVAAGEILVLRGANGIGKTSLLRTIVGLQNPGKGQIKLETDPVYAAHLEGLKPSLTVRENLMFWAQIFGQSDIDTALDVFDLSQLCDRRAAHLSAGQKRRLGLARVFVSRCPLWVMDEPTANLDQTNTDLFLKVLKDHIAQGGAAIFSSHLDINIPHRVADLTAFVAKPVTSGDPFGEAVE